MYVDKNVRQSVCGVRLSYYADQNHKHIPYSSNFVRSSQHPMSVQVACRRRQFGDVMRVSKSARSYLTAPPWSKRPRTMCDSAARSNPNYTDVFDVYSDGDGDGDDGGDGVCWPLIEKEHRLHHSSVRGEISSSHRRAPGMCLGDHTTSNSEDDVTGVVAEDTPSKGHTSRDQKGEGDGDGDDSSDTGSQTDEDDGRERVGDGDGAGDEDEDDEEEEDPLLVHCIDCNIGGPPEGFRMCPQCEGPMCDDCTAVSPRESVVCSMCAW